MDKKPSVLFVILLLNIPFSFSSDQYTDNPKVFSVLGIPVGFGDHFFAFDLTRDGRMDYLYRTRDKVYAYSHDGVYLWERAVDIPGKGDDSDDDRRVNGATLAAGDITLDGSAEVLAMNNNNQVIILRGDTGEPADTLSVSVGEYQLATYLQTVNLRGQGDVDLIVQTTDVLPEGNEQYYINRSIIAYRLDTKAELWRVNQDREGSSGETWYEGYWGQAHGSFFAADVNGSGLDKIIGGNMVNHDGTLADLSYPRGWIGKQLGSDGKYFIDHLDCIAVGNFFTDTLGLAWCLTQEDHAGDSNEWHTALVNKDGVIWRVETTLPYTGEDKEPQNVAVGRFSGTSNDIYVWNRSRFSWFENDSLGQQPWIFNQAGVQITDYLQKDVLPEGFSGDNRHGLEMIWIIDWDGSGKEYIAGKARFGDGGHAGVFDAITGEPVWTSMPFAENLQAKTLYVADVSGDSREELIVFDLADNKIKIFHNDDPFTDTNPNKWDDPLYRRLKQNWDYYSPGSYTAGDPVQLSVRVFLEGPYNSGASAMNTSLLSGGHLPAASPYAQAPKILVSADDIPADAVDWVMIELRAAPDGHAVYRHSAFLRSDGQIMDENGNAYVNVFADKNNLYYIVIRHRNHLAVMSALSVDFSSGTASWDFTDNLTQYYGNDAALLKEGVYGMWAGDGNQSGIVTIADINVSLNNRDHVGYHLGDYNLSGIVTISDANIAFKNRDAATNVQQ